ncbi:MAG TPA: ribonuclease Y [Candidatus Wolfebacteria bacterium]|nr:ribonuclease Y [Candidatus Wolfebacteria bacterium]
MNYQHPLFWATLITSGLVAGYFIRQLIALRQGSSIEQKIKNQLDETNTKSKEIILDAQKKATGILEEIKKEERERKNQLNRLEERLIKKEELTEKQLSDLKLRESEIDQDIEKLKISKTQIEELNQKVHLKLEEIAKLSFSEAKDYLLKETEIKYQQEITSAIQKLEKKRKEEIEHKSLEIITTAIQRYARSHISEITTTIFNLPGEDLKGKIIGREGRNIRTLERLTGAELIIDETPDSLTISSFDPVRREIAKLALEKLIKDGRIQPAKIEEKVEEARSEINKKITETGEAAAYEVGIYDLPKEIIQLLGRLHFRTSYGQNVLVHSIETAYLAAMLASELGLDVETTKKGALLHDIGKAIDHEVQGSHIELGIRILKKYGIADEIIESMKSHHEDYPFSTSESYIVAAADALSAARPGARRDTLENYIKRLGDLEKIASEFEGVKTVYAISAGRELRVFVTPEKIDDFKALQLAKDIANKIESELKYPGQIKVNVIREVRAVEYAK